MNLGLSASRVLLRNYWTTLPDTRQKGEEGRYQAEGTKYAKTWCHEGAGVDPG